MNALQLLLVLLTMVVPAAVVVVLLPHKVWVKGVPEQEEPLKICCGIWGL